jgi:Erv1 / Alr family
MGLCPEKFGPYFWATLHMACLFGTDKEALETFIQAFANVLPCHNCQWHFKRLLQEAPPPTGGTDLEYFAWSVDIHNKVNDRLKKPRVSYEEALELWGKCDVDERPDWTTIGLVVALLALIIILFVKFKK